MNITVSKIYPKQILVISLIFCSTLFITACAKQKPETSIASPAITPSLAQQPSLRLSTKPLTERVKAAETVFVGTLINKVTVGDWVTAELLVEEPLVNAKNGNKVEVTWRATIHGRAIYDTAESSRGIAILSDKRQGRFWLRGDKFEDVNKLAEVKSLIN